MDTRTRPTANEMKKGPTVTMVGTHYAGQEVSFHGLAYNVAFDAKGTAQVYGPHYDEWIGDDRAAQMGFVVSKPAVKAPAKKAAAKKATK